MASIPTQMNETEKKKVATSKGARESEICVDDTFWYSANNNKDDCNKKQSPITPKRKEKKRNEGTKRWCPIFELTKPQIVQPNS